MNTFRYEVLVRGIFLYEKKQRNIGQHICQVFKIFSHRLYCRFVPMCGVIGHLCVCVCFGENNSYTGNQAVSIGISALSAMFAGFLSAKLCHSKGLIMGLFSGLILFACVLISAFSTGGNVFTVSTAMRFLLMMIGGAFGGVLAVNKRKKVK